MATKYRVYSNDLAGGPIELSDSINLQLQDAAALLFQDGADAQTGSSPTPIADNLTGLTYATSPLPLGAEASYLVRAFDDVTGLEDPNLDARVDITLDSAGVDRTGVPVAPMAVSVKALSGGNARVEWSYLPPAGGAEPTSFSIWLTAGASVDFGAAAAASVAYDSPGLRYVADLSGLADGTAYAVGVRAVNGAGDDGNTTAYAVTGDGTAPNPVEQLTASVIWSK